MAAGRCFHSAAALPPLPAAADQRVRIVALLSLLCRCLLLAAVIAAMLLPFWQQVCHSPLRVHSQQQCCVVMPARQKRVEDRSKQWSSTLLKAYTVDMVRGRKPEIIWRDYVELSHWGSLKQPGRMKNHFVKLDQMRRDYHDELIEGRQRTESKGMADNGDRAAREKAEAKAPKKQGEVAKLCASIAQDLRQFELEEAEQKEQEKGLTGSAGAEEPDREEAALASVRDLEALEALEESGSAAADTEEEQAVEEGLTGLAGAEADTEVEQEEGLGGSACLEEYRARIEAQVRVEVAAEMQDLWAALIRPMWCQLRPMGRRRG